MVRVNYWRGYFTCLAGDESETEALEYSSDSGWYVYNKVRKIAYRHGVRDCKEMLESRQEMLTRRLPVVLLDLERSSGMPRIPGQVYAEAYGEMRRGYKPSANVGTGNKSKTWMP